MHSKYNRRVETVFNNNSHTRLRVLTRGIGNVVVLAVSSHDINPHDLMIQVIHLIHMLPLALCLLSIC